MDFSFSGYRKLLHLLKDNAYFVANYHNYTQYDRCVILRHDIDMMLRQAVCLAELEREEQVSSTYFVLLKTDFYNPASADSVRLLHRLQELGHEVGLHFDEKAYPEATPEETIQRIQQERDILSAILGTNVTCVSMHRPSPKTLEANLNIPGMINSYSQAFFHEFKYLSDSRRRWREPVEQIIQSGQYRRLHILTHAFWYRDTEQSMEQLLRAFIAEAGIQRYNQLNDNFTDLDQVLCKDEFV